MRRKHLTSATKNKQGTQGPLEREIIIATALLVVHLFVMIDTE
jgi:hypothetical protein